MIRATTPTHKFVLPFDYASYVKELLITYRQGNEIILEKDKNGVSFDGNTIYLHLSQEETNLFKVNISVDIQVRVLTNRNEAMASEIYKLSVKEVLNDEVLK